MPQEAGIYFFLDEKNNVLYVGKAKNLKNRVASYFTRNSYILPKTRLLVSKIAKIKTILVNSEIESLLLEANYIKKYKPKYNVSLIDGKAYPLIRIIIKDRYPKVLIVRREEDNSKASGSLYFGPFPNTSAMRMVLRTVRRIFPFQSVANHPKRICLYNHLGLCPCPPMFQTEEERKRYKKNIFYLILFLQGQKKKVIKDLEKERKFYSKNEQFEEAKRIQQQINSIHYITSPIHKPFEYETNPNLKDDLRRNELISLKKHFLKAGVSVENLDRIECYDISNIAGTHAVGSMVVFTNGEKDTSSYRKFKIRLTTGPNDFAMIEEVLGRRLNHGEWEFPKLIIVDGGKGQISSALKALDEQHLSIPLIGLAKREEIIITSDFKEIRLPKDSEALKLVMRIRDEAHRFAITYHRKLRSKLAIQLVSNSNLRTHE